MTESSTRPLKVEQVPRQVMENQLLVALDDKDKIAVVLTETDLDLLIESLGYARSFKDGPNLARAKMRADLKELREVAFRERVSDYA